MKTREATIHAEESYTTAGTKIIPILVKDPISRLLIPYGVTCGAGARTAHHSAAFTKIEIVDGSDVLLSLTGPQVDGIARFDSKGPAGTYTSPSASITDYGTFVIDFGRFLYDKALAFNPANYKNPQIQLTLSLTAVDAASTVVIAAVHAFLMEESGVTLQGFLMKKELKSWVAAASSWEYTQLPRDYPYRRLFLQALTKTIGVATHWSRARLSEDNDKRVPFDVLVDDQISKNCQDYGQVTENCSGAISAVATPFFAAPAYGGSVMAMCTMATNALEGHNRDGGQYEVKSANGTDDFRGIVSGLCPQGLVAFHMGPKDVIEDWYDPKNIGSLQLEVYGAGAYTIHLLAEQLRPY